MVFLAKLSYLLVVKPVIFASFQRFLGVFRWFRRPFGLVFGGFRWFSVVSEAIWASFQLFLGGFRLFRRPFGLVFSAVWWFLGGFRWFRSHLGGLVCTRM